MMFTQEEYDEAWRRGYDRGFNRGSGMDPKVQHTEAYIDVRERDLERAEKRERAKSEVAK